MKKLIQLLLLGAAFSCCADTPPGQSPDMQLVLQYPNRQEGQCGDYYEIIHHLSRECKTSLKLAHNIYFDGEYYYVVKQRPLRKFVPPATSEEVKRQAFAKFTKDEVAKLLQKDTH